MTRFIHLTDIHLSAPEVADATLDSDTVATLQRVLDQVAALDPAPAFIVMSGDLTNRGHDESYDLLARMIAPVEIPIFLALGNHDRRAGFHRAFPGLGAHPDAPLDHDRVLGGLHVITLDTAEPGRVGGRLDAEQLDWLAAALAREPGRRKLLVLHHPPSLDPGRAGRWTTLDQPSTEALARVVAGHDIAGILSGHVHYNRVAHWLGIPVVISVGQHASVDLLARGEVRIVESAGFAICDLLPGGLSASFVPVHPGRVIRRVPLERLNGLA